MSAAVFVGGSFAEYQRLGDAAIAILCDYTPLVERISIDEAFADVAGCTQLSGSPADIAATIRRRIRTELGLPISVGVARTKHLARIASQFAKPDGMVLVDPKTEQEFLHDLPVDLMWGVGPVTKAKLTEQGILTIGQLANTPGRSIEHLLGTAVGEKLSALAWNRDPRAIQTQHRARSAGAQSALWPQGGRRTVFKPALLHLADRIASRPRAKSLAGSTVTVRVRFADMRAVTRSTTLDAPISATVMLAEIAGDLVRVALADHPSGPIKKDLSRKAAAGVLLEGWQLYSVSESLWLEQLLGFRLLAAGLIKTHPEDMLLSVDNCRTRAHIFRSSIATAASTSYGEFLRS